MAQQPLEGHRIFEPEGPSVIAMLWRGKDVRATGVHHHPRGQLFGASEGLLVVEAGQGNARAQWVVPAIHAVWIPPHYHHGARSHGPYHGWTLHVAESLCQALPEQACTLRTTPLLLAAIERAASWPDEPLDAPSERLARVILDEIRVLDSEPLGLPMPAEIRLQRIALALTRDPADNRGLDAWAHWAGLSPRTLSRRFKAETGFTFAGWRQRARLLRALERLAEGVPVTAVALESGYDNVSAFIAMFRRAFGTTPGRYFHTADA